MSLPEGKLTLQALPQLGDAHPKKHAMIVRLSTETMEALDRLESGAKIDIDFGEGSSKLYIGDSSFTLSAQPETVSHELYLRMVAANRPGATVLKLQGNVVGKLNVERQLNAQAEAAVRDRTQQAEKQRHERKIELLDAPLAQAPRSSLKKPKAAGKPPKSVPAGHAPPPDPNRTVSGSTSLQTSQAASPRISPRPSSASAPEKSARYRLIHCVALRPRTLKQILDLVGGDDKERRREVRDLMPEVLEKVPSKDQENMYRLKTESWLEVRPFENTYLRPDEVQKLVEQGQEALKRLFVDESNALWNHFRREGGPAASGTRGVRASPVPPPPEPKKPVVKKRPTETTKKKVTDTIPMKDESVRPPKVEVRVKDRAETPTTSAAAAKSAQRRLPGSGHRVNSQSTTPPTLSDTAPTTAASTKRQGVDRDIKRDAPSPAPGPSRPSTSMPPPPGKVIKREDPESKKKDSSQASRADDPRVKKRAKPEPGEIEQSPRKRPREIAESDYSDRDSVASFGTKRRKPNERDSDRERAPVRTKVKAEHRDVSAIKKQTRDASPLPARVKEEREPTPLIRSPVPVPRSPALPPRPQLQPERGASVASNGVRDAQREEPAVRHGSAKGRRREPSFTSSSEEDAPAAKERKRGRSPGAGAGKLREREPPRKAGPLPSDVRALRRLYDERIPEFVALRSKKKRLRDEMKRVARRMRDEGVDDLSTDCELPDDAECESLRKQEADAREECVRIRDALYRLTGQEIPEDGGLWSEDTD